MESQSGHHPGHHGHSAPHNSTLPHHVHVGGSASHQINLDNHKHHSSQASHQTKHKNTEQAEHKPHKTHTSHHHHHHVSKSNVCCWRIDEKMMFTEKAFKKSEALLRCSCFQKDRIELHFRLFVRKEKKRKRKNSRLENELMRLRSLKNEIIGKKDLCWLQAFLCSTL